MVGLSRVLNAGFILSGQSVFQDVAAPHQALIEQYNIVKYLGGSGPYIQNSGYGISTDIPENALLNKFK